MSRRRLISTAVVLVGVVGGAMATTVVALPLGWPIGAAAARTQEVVDSKDPGVRLPRVVSEVNPTYTPEALRAKIEGTVVMNAVVGTDGTPEDIEITKSLDEQYGLDKQAVAALNQWRFAPGLKDGKPVPVRITVEMRFTLRLSVVLREAGATLWGAAPARRVSSRPTTKPPSSSGKKVNCGC